MSILYCIIHTQHQNTRIKNITDTWGQNQSILFYSDHHDPENYCYKVCDRSDYASGQIKQINVFDMLLHKFNKYDWYFFCDNDTFINTKALEYYILNAETNYVHGQILNTWPEDTTLLYLSGGAGYLMHHDIVQKMQNLLYNDTQYGDVSIGINFRSKNIPIKHSDLFKSQLPSFYNISDNDIKKYITFHYVSEYNVMKKLYLLCK